MIDEHAQPAPTDNLGEQHLDLGLAGREPLFDIRLQRCHLFAFYSSTPSGVAL
jgi:hypothetical protein